MRSLDNNQCLRARGRSNSICAWICILMACTGCRMVRPMSDSPIVAFDAPRELDKVTLPEYRIGPPDILSIEVLQHVADEDYSLHIGDTIFVAATGAPPDEPIEGVFPIATGGKLQLGYGYGAVAVAGKTIEDATAAIEQHLAGHLRDPKVTISLRQASGMQPVSGEHLVGPDGAVRLGRYGSVRVAGMSLDEARDEIAAHLSQFLADPEVALSVYAFNSQVYYIVTQGGGMGDSLERFPFTGNETVMDALSQISGLSSVSSTRMWVVRPHRSDGRGNQILPVDWEGITQRGEVDTNYQLLPGDRLFVAEDRLVAMDSSLAKFVAPLERVLGFTLLGTATTARLSGKVLKKGNTGLLNTVN